MARPRSEDKRDAILASAIKLIAAQGLGAPTALIAKKAGVANGLLFNYFPTKADLLNHLFLELKTEMATAAMDGLPAKSELREQVFHVWSNWVGWASSNPDKRRALAQLVVSDEITPSTRAAAHKAMASIGELMERIHANGPMSKAPMGFVAVILNSLAEATMDFIAQDPKNADEHTKVGFEALWRVVA